MKKLIISAAVFAVGLLSLSLAKAQTLTPLLVTDAQYLGVSCGAVPWNNTVWTVGLPDADSLVSARDADPGTEQDGVDCGNAAILRFGDLLDTDPVTVCPANPNDTASQCSARGESWLPAGDFRTAPPPPPPPQCSDGVDNDSDGLIDLADPGCVDSNDDDETDPPTGQPPVPPAGLASIAFSWDAPTTFNDGTAIPPGTTITYRLYQSQTIDARNTGVMIAEVSGLGALIAVLLPVGTFYYVVTAVIGGVESDPSNEVAVARP